MPNETQGSDHDLLIKIIGELCGMRKELKSSQALMDQRCKGHQKETDVLTKAMFGNGGRGIKTRVEIMWWSFGLVSLLSTGCLVYWVTRG